MDPNRGYHVIVWLPESSYDAGPYATFARAVQEAHSQQAGLGAINPWTVAFESGPDGEPSAWESRAAGARTALVVQVITV